MALVWEGAADAQEGKLDVHPRGHLLFVRFHPQNAPLTSCLCCRGTLLLPPGGTLVSEAVSCGARSQVMLYEKLISSD